MKLLFSNKYLVDSKSILIKKEYKSFASKYETVSRIETEVGFNNDCLIFFALRKVPPLVNGKTVKKECGVICFPKTGAETIKQTFTDLLNKMYKEAINNEDDLLKLPKLPKGYLMKVQYYSPFQLTELNVPTETPTVYVDCNEEGVSFNKNNV